jgi:hypothetical protein
MWGVTSVAALCGVYLLRVVVHLYTLLKSTLHNAAAVNMPDDYHIPTATFLIRFLIRFWQPFAAIALISVLPFVWIYATFNFSIKAFLSILFTVVSLGLICYWIPKFRKHLKYQ